MLPIEDQPLPPPIVHAPETRAPRTAAVMRGDVIRHLNLFANYIPAWSERLFFDIHGHRIMGAYKDIGDYVEEGDVLATLYWPDITTLFEYATRREEWLQLDLSQLERRRRAGAIERDFYQAERARLTREIEILTMELEYLTRQNQRRYLLSPINGIVTQIVVFTEGMVSSTSTAFATIVDQSISVFMVRPTIAEPLMTVGSYFTIYLGSAPYRGVVVDPEEFGINRDSQGETFMVFADENPVVPTPPLATVYVELEKAENVLFIPARALRRASDRVFVYVLTQDGIRVLRDVEIGTRGNATYEITGGLYEGELVIID